MDIRIRNSLAKSQDVPYRESPVYIYIITDAAAHVVSQIEALLTHALVGAGRVETEMLTAVRGCQTLVDVCKKHGHVTVFRRHSTASGNSEKAFISVEFDILI